MADSSFSFLPPSLSENNDAARAAFEGRLHSSDCYGLRRVFGQAGVPPQPLEELSVEGGCFGLSCYLRPEGKGGPGVTLTTLHNNTVRHSHHWK